MRAFLVGCAAVTFAFFATGADARFHLFRIVQVYSNADGTVQFIVLYSGDNGENLWGGQFISTTGGVAGFTRFDFPNDLPFFNTAGRSVLIATQGFANLGIIAPDYVVPNNFVPIGGGRINFADADGITYAAGELPTDGINAMSRSGKPVMNLAENFVGKSASITAGGGGAAANYQGLWWKSDESGWGVNFVHQGEQVFGTWYTYDTTGKAWWLSMLANKTAGGTYTGTIYVDSGPPFNNFAGSATPVSAGTGTVTFSDANTGTFSYTITGGATQTKAITRYDLGTGPKPTCTYSAAAPNFAAATNYQDLWWAASGTESGWGVNFTHQGNYVFATWYTYDASGAPLWLSALAQRVGTSNVYTGTLLRTAGPRYDNYKTTDLGANQNVGTLTLTFTNGNSATFNYVTNGTGGLPAVNQTKSIARFPFGAGGTVCQ